MNVYVHFFFCKICYMTLKKRVINRGTPQKHELAVKHRKKVVISN